MSSVNSLLLPLPIMINVRHRDYHTVCIKKHIKKYHTETIIKHTGSWFSYSFFVYSYLQKRGENQKMWTICQHSSDGHASTLLELQIGPDGHFASAITHCNSGCGSRMI